MHSHRYNTEDTIAALATAAGMGAIAVLRLSGPEAFAICDSIFSGKKISKQPSHTIHFGRIQDDGKEIDEVLISIFKGPNSYTGEDVAEISCHGSVFIQQQILDLLVKKGARLAGPGEFTLRAFLNQKMDLTQAEAVSDMITADSEAASNTALKQMRGGFSAEIKALREKLVHFASLIELELDFSEEDVEFADRSQLVKLISEIQTVSSALISSFRYGNVVKQGFSTVIAGRPNAGKSTLLNAILKEERAIVSEIAGTTRDTIEEMVQINGITFRFVDTAGIRSDAESPIEIIGIGKTMEKLEKAAVVIYLFDINQMSPQQLQEDLQHLQKPGLQILKVANKVDKAESARIKEFEKLDDIIFVSAAKQDIQSLHDALYMLAAENKLGGDQTLVTNIRHLEALQKINTSLDSVINGIQNNISGDFLAEDIRSALYHLGEITGQVTTDDLLGNIFSKFCIGK